MPFRKVILATGEIYHIFNRSSHQIPIFTTKNEFRLFLQVLRYYLQKIPPVKFSLYRQQSHKYQLHLSDRLVKILAYCLMPNHFHLILKQIQDNGIKMFIQRISISYGKYFNIKHEQNGPVFGGRFKAVRMESDEQLIHLSRYIHLNPVTSSLVRKPEEYDFSSYKIYLGQENSDFIDPSAVTSSFTPQSYQEFVLAQKTYQIQLKMIKHLLLE